MNPRRKIGVLLPALLAAAMIGGREIGWHPVAIGINTEYGIPIKLTNPNSNKSARIGCVRRTN